MRVLLSTYDSRGGVEPLVALAVQLRALGAEVRVCAPPDEEFAERLTGVGVPLVPVGDSVRTMVTRDAPPSEAELRQHMDELIAVQFGTVAAATRSVTEKLGLRYVYASYHPTFLPSPHHPPPGYSGWPFSALVTDNRVLWDMYAQNVNELFGATLNGRRAAIGLPPVDNVSDYAFADQPWLAADPTLGPWQEPADLDVVVTGAWLLADERPLPPEFVAFLDAGEPPVYVGFGSMALRAAKDIAGSAIEAIRAQGRRAILGRRWADLTLIDGRDDCFAVGEVNQQALFPRVAAVVDHGGAGTTTTAARAGAPQVVMPQGADQVYWAGRVADMGIGSAHVGLPPTVGSLSAALQTTLAPETRARATDVAGTIRADGATVAAMRLLDVVSRERPPADLAGPAPPR